MENKDKRDIIDELYLTSMRIENILDIADILAAKLDNFNPKHLIKIVSYLRTLFYCGKQLIIEQEESIEGVL
ncbi:MAG: hypothetical protein FWE03_05765 [Firmicutes bacterium]|nr:hypothetical protein [Bacillota bacterium]